MRVFVAGASGAIGQPLITELIRQGHAVTGMTRTDSGARSLSSLGAAVAQVSALDQVAVADAIKKSRPEVIVDELTALPSDPSQMAAAAPGDRRLRLEGGGNLLQAAQACGVRRYIQQTSAFFLKASNGLADETSPLAVDATPGVAANAKAYAELEERVLNASGIEGIALRYGFFYGPKTWYRPDGAIGDQVRKQNLPVIGEGMGSWSFVHIEDAALATAAALAIPPGIYNIVDDDPAPVSRWLPEFARWVGAAPPPHLTEQEALRTLGEDAVYYYTRLVGASNHKAKQTFGFKPRRLQWLE